MAGSSTAFIPKSLPRTGIAAYDNFAKQLASFGKPSAGLAGNPLVGYASQMGQANAIGNFAKAPSFKSGVTGAATYALNANPYYAGINALTGGALDKAFGRGVNSLFQAFGLSKRPPAQDAAQLARDTEAARMAEQSANKYRDYAARSRQEAERMGGMLDLYRRRAENLRTFGPSSREVAGSVGAAIGPMTAAAEAARARTAANMSARGLTPTGGIGAGMQAGVEQGIAQGMAGVMPRIYQDIANRQMVMDRSLLSADLQAQQAAYGREQQAMTTADELALRQRALDLQQQQQQLQAEQAAAARRAAESQGIGQFLTGAYAAYQAGRRPQVSTDNTQNDQYAKLLERLISSMGTSQPLGSNGYSGIPTAPNLAPPIVMQNLNAQYPNAGDGASVFFAGQEYKKIGNTWYAVAGGVV